MSADLVLCDLASAVRCLRRCRRLLQVGTKEHVYNTLPVTTVWYLRGTR